MILSTFLKLSCAALILSAITALMYLAERKTAFGRIQKRIRMLLIGLLYGGLAICGTEFGVDIGGATANIRDAAPLCAGLFFGGPAGVIAGLIGGVERWFAAQWGAGMYTRLACSIATVLSGVAAALTRKYLFEDKKPAWFSALCAGLVMEVVHMLLIFVTNMADIHQAFYLVRQCSAPMILANGAAVMLSSLAVSRISGEKTRVDKKSRGIAQRFQSLLLICVVIAFLFTCVFTYLLQANLSVADTDMLLTMNIRDVKADVEAASGANLLAITKRIAAVLGGETPDGARLSEIARINQIAEINVINEHGIITASTNPNFVGYDMASDAQSAEFMCLANGTDSFVQSYQSISYDSAISRKYAGVAFKSGGFVQVGYDAEQFQDDIAQKVVGVTRYRRVGEGGAVIICDEKGLIVSDRVGYEGKMLTETGLDLAQYPQDKRFFADVYGVSCVCLYTMAEGYPIIALIPREEAEINRDLSVYMMAFMEIALFTAVFMQIYFLIRRIIVDNIMRVNDSLARITDGDLSVQVNVRASSEFSSLSDDINATVDTLKRYIAEADARIDRELAFAKAIQYSALPNVFPPYPERKEFDIYAMMRTAKEVGGDFYDFYFVGENKLAFLIADVSGKGIPAALFMMRAKTLIKSLAETGRTLADVFTGANDSLCENNDAGMFVTAWLGVLAIDTGRVEFVNAGHNPPLIRKKDGGFEYLKSRAGFVLAGIEGVKYHSGEFMLEPGDTLFLYTDGVTEATDKQEKLYGEPRLQSTLNALPRATPRQMTEAVLDDIDRFVGKAPQFDDITMLAVTYLGADGMLKQWAGTPDLAALENVTAFVEDTLSEAGCPMPLVIKMNIAVDEIFSNIARYSGAKNARVLCGVADGTATLRFIDDGLPYDPTAQADPDTTLPAHERDIGGLGILMVKKTMDLVRYAYHDGQNVLTLEKKI